MRYANDGDGVEHRTAIAEDDTGELRLLSYSDGSVTVSQIDEVREHVAA